MDALQASAASLGLFYSMRTLNDPDYIVKAVVRLIAKIPTMVAAFQLIRKGQDPIQPRDDLTYAENFLYMLTERVPDPTAARIFDACLILHAEHSLNASTFTARVIIATRSDIASAICGAVGAMKGPLHGGAPAEVIGQLGEIGSIDRAEDWARGKLSRKELIMGFGHRVYRAYDPRAAALRKVAEAMPTRPAWLELAIGAEEQILKVFEEMKPGRAMKTNVEFYAAAVLQGVGLVPDLFPATFALARIAGWSAHAIEQAGVDKLIRPDAKYIGHAERHLPA
jgi:citrate synthase